MNWDTIEGKWKQVKGNFREKWGDLTDDQLEEAAGKKDQLAGLLQEKYGMTKENAEIALQNWATRSEEADTSETVWNHVQGRWTELMGHFKEKYGSTVDDELTESKGRRDILAGMIQREQNISLGDAYELVDDWAYDSYRSANLTGGGK